MVRPRSPSSIVDYAHRALVLGLVGIAGWGVWLTAAVYVSRIGHKERFPLGNAGGDRETLTDVARRLIGTPQEGTERAASETDPTKRV